MTSVDQSRVATLPAPPEPPVSFGRLGPEFDLEFPTCGDPVDSSEELEQSPILVDAVHTKSRVRKFTPQRGSVSVADQAQEPILDRTATISEVPEEMEEPAPDIDFVRGAWNDYHFARIEMQKEALAAHEAFERARLGSRLAAGAGMVLCEWALQAKGKRIITVGIHARMKRGPQATPVRLDVTRNGGAPISLFFQESQREEVRYMAAEIRRRGKVATQVDRDEFEEITAADLAEDLRPSFVAYCEKVRNYAEVAGLDYVEANLGRLSISYRAASVKFAAAVVGDELSAPPSDLKIWFDDLSWGNKALVVVVGIFLAVILIVVMGLVV